MMRAILFISWGFTVGLVVGASHPFSPIKQASAFACELADGSLSVPPWETPPGPLPSCPWNKPSSR
jgi:hypothetical protein